MDKQYVSLAGQPDGEVWLVDYRQPPGHTNVLVRPRYCTDPIRLDLGNIRPPADGGWHDALKVSGVFNAQIWAGEVIGGSEDVLDVNHSSNLEICLRRAAPTGRYVATIKGGTYNVGLKIEEQAGHGRETDIDLGNWSDQSSKRTAAISLDARTADGSPVRVRQLHATRPVLASGGRWKLSSWMAPWFQSVYAALKKVGLA